MSTESTATATVTMTSEDGTTAAFGAFDLRLEHIAGLRATLSSRAMRFQNTARINTARQLREAEASLAALYATHPVCGQAALIAYDLMWATTDGGRQFLTDNPDIEFPVGAHKAAALLAEHTGLEITAGDIRHLAKYGLLREAGRHNGWPLYSVAQLHQVAVWHSEEVRELITDRATA